MTSLPPAPTKSFSEDTLEKKIYSIVESFKDNIPIVNDRNRLGYSLYKFMTGEGDPPEVSIKNTKLKLENINEKDLAEQIDKKLKAIK
ncbi:hypothetical protein BMS3Abin04_00143 [bacterium BMS3Abin04]|nr:hypothetical protein BMS3Abin04_00143 [bacterium BMS3Abin04]